MVRAMQRGLLRFGIAIGLVGFLPAGGRAEAPARAATAFDAYAGTVEARLAQQHRTREAFLAGDAGTADGHARLRQGDLVIEEIRTPPVPGAMLHDWRGSAFAQGAKAADFENLLRDFSGYPRVFAPQVVKARTFAVDGGHVQGMMRVRQQHVITVVLDTTCDVHFGRIDAQDGWSASRSTQIKEIEGIGTSHERPLSPQAEHGFLWRINTYWSWQERDGGLYMQVESVSLTRGIPTGLGWVVSPFVESVPRESLEFTLKAARNSVQVTDDRLQNRGQ